VSHDGPLPNAKRHLPRSSGTYVNAQYDGLLECQTPGITDPGLGRGGITGLTSVHITRMRVRINMDMVRVSRVSARVSISNSLLGLLR